MVNTIDFSADGITVDGTLIGFPLTTAKTREVFGAPRLSAGKDHAVQTWDALGIKTFGPLDGTLVSILDIFPEGRTEENYSYNPTGGFPGAITVNGVHVDAVGFTPGFAADKLYLELGPYILSRALNRPGGGFYDFFIRRTDADYFSRADGIKAAKQHLAVHWRQPTDAAHTIDLSAAGVAIDDILVALPADPSDFVELLGEPREQARDGASHWFWDALGLRASGLPGVVAAFAVVDGVGGPDSPLSPATGIHLTIGGAEPTAATWDTESTFARTARLGDAMLERSAQPGAVLWELRTLQEVRAVTPRSVPVVPAVVAAAAAAVAAPVATLRAIAKGDYTIKNLVEPVLTFTDFGVKLQVIEELMYKQSKLKPRFDIEDFTAWLPDRVVDLAAEGGAPIPEARVYFENLPIPSRFAYDVKSLVVSPTATVFSQLQPLGTPVPVELSSLDDLAQFPYLKKVTLEFSQEAEGIDELEKRAATVVKVDAEQ